MRESWKKERGMLKGRIKELQKKVERLERGEKGRDGEAGVEKKRFMEMKLREMLIKIDKKEREERRANIIVEGIKVDEREGKEAIEELWEQMEVKEEVMEIRKVGGLDGERRGKNLVRLRGVVGKRKIMEARKRLKGGKVRVEDDRRRNLTGEERRAK